MRTNTKLIFFLDQINSLNRFGEFFPRDCRSIIISHLMIALIQAGHLIALVNVARPAGRPKQILTCYGLQAA